MVEVRAQLKRPEKQPQILRLRLRMTISSAYCCARDDDRFCKMFALGMTTACAVACEKVRKNLGGVRHGGRPWICVSHPSSAGADERMGQPRTAVGDYLLVWPAPVFSSRAACAAASRAVKRRKGEQET